MSVANKYVFLAEDDIDDRYFFENALKEVSKETKLTTAIDGVELMQKLDENVPPRPTVIFLDLNMPRKNGFECLAEIRATDKLKNIPVIIFSTSSAKVSVNKGFENGADYYIHKPNNFSKLKSLITEVLTINWENQSSQPSRESSLYLLFSAR